MKMASKKLGRERAKVRRSHVSAPSIQASVYHMYHGMYQRTLSANCGNRYTTSTMIARVVVLLVAGVGISSAFNLRAKPVLPQTAHAQIKRRGPRCNGKRSSTDDGVVSASPAQSALTTVAMRQHHMAMKTSNIEMSIAFYSLLDFYPVAKFRSGPARAAWLEHQPDGSSIGDKESPDNNIGSTAARIELIEVPEEILLEGMVEEARKKVPRKRALDRISNPAVLGWDHMCLDVTDSICAMSTSNLQGWIDALNSRSQSKFGKDLRVALQPRVKVFGKEKFELAFIYDADGGLIELVNLVSDSGSEMESSWDDEDDSRIRWRNA